jgi:hypothetical protein
MDSAEQQVVEHLKQARNVLVTVRNNPTVDLLSACIGLTLGLDKMDKHVAAVFSGEVPSTIEFLKPEETLEQTPDSLRDFIIALDKSKADKLRYKVEDKIVRIFITPYKTSLSQSDLEFSEGDFNVDAVVALGAHEQQELDQAITEHGRILHDATVMSINNTPNGSLGTINWQDTTASSISEMATKLVKDLDKNVFDEQIATALLTGIVAETERFSNEKTNPNTMTLAGDLMAAGANQQLVANELEDAHQIRDRANSGPIASNQSNAQGTGAESSKPDDGTLDIDHRQAEQPAANNVPSSQSSPTSTMGDDAAAGSLPNRDMLPLPEPGITGVRGTYQDENQFTGEYVEKDKEEESSVAGRAYLVDEPALPDNTPVPANPTEPSTLNPFDVPPAGVPEPLLDHDTATTTPDESDQETLAELEQEVHSPHLQPAAGSDLTSARNDVLEALKSGPQPIQPLTSLNANPLGDELHPSTDNASTAVVQSPHSSEVEIDPEGNLTAKPAVAPEGEPNQPLDMPLPGSMPSVNPVVSPAAPSSTTLPPPPPVPPPFMPSNFS